MQTDLSDRIAGLLYGSLVGDALALGAHWIYDQEQLLHDCGRMTEYRDPLPGSYHPHKKLGQQTHYGDQLLTLLNSLQAHGGWNAKAFATDWQRMWDGYPDYLDHATKETLANLPAGGPASSSEELGGAGRIAPLLALLAGEPVDSAVAAAREQTALTHGSAIAADAAEFLTRLTFGYLRGEDSAIGAHYDLLDPKMLLERVESTRSMTVSAAAKTLGLACPAPQALPTVVMLVERCGNDLEDAMIENVMAGGDNAARGIALGMLLGAKHGRSAIPERWLRELEAAPRVEQFLASLGSR